MKSDDVSASVDAMVSNTVIELCDTYTSPNTVPYEWHLSELQRDMQSIYDIALDVQAIADDASITFELFKQQLVSQVEDKFNKIISVIPAELLKAIEKELMLKTLDSAWKKHLVAIEHLRRSINLQAYAQKNPLNEYKVEAFRVFEDMMKGVRHRVTSAIMHLSIPDELLHPSETQDLLNTSTDHVATPEFEADEVVSMNGSNLLLDNVTSLSGTVPSRNSACPCGSGVRYKDCHGRIERISFALQDQSTSDDDFRSHSDVSDFPERINASSVGIVSSNTSASENVMKESDLENTSTFDLDMQSHYDLSPNLDHEISNNSWISSELNNEEILQQDHAQMDLSMTAKDDESITVITDANAGENESPQEILQNFAEDQRRALLDTGRDTEPVKKTLSTKKSSSGRIRSVKKKVIVEDSESGKSKTETDSSQSSVPNSDQHKKPGSKRKVTNVVNDSETTTSEVKKSRRQRKIKESIEVATERPAKKSKLKKTPLHTDNKETADVNGSTKNPVVRRTKRLATKKSTVKTKTTPVDE
jgi:hypothetical protein